MTPHQQHLPPAPSNGVDFDIETNDSAAEDRSESRGRVREAIDAGDVSEHEDGVDIKVD